MQKSPVLAAIILLAFGSFALAQQPSQAGPAPAQLTPQMLGEMLRSATSFHELVQNLNLNKALGPDQHVLGPDGRLHHPLDRTAESIGAGAGAGAAIGAMTHSQNGVLIGALVGGAGGLIVDQIVKHREELRQKAIDGPAPEAPRGFKDREQ